MTARQQQLTDIVQTLASIVRNIQLRLALHDVCPEPHLNFWRLIYGDLTDFAVLECCKLFASDDEQHQTTHWKNVWASLNTMVSMKKFLKLFNFIQTSFRKPRRLTWTGRCVGTQIN
jgi:hypothetical protein